MKNNFKLILYIFLFIILNNSSISDEFEVKSNLINVTEEGNIINASGEVEVKSNNNLIIRSDKSILDKKKSLLISSGNVFFIDKENNLEIKTDKVIFDRIENIATIQGTSEIFFKDKFKLSSTKVIYDKNNNVVYSNEKSALSDKKGNLMKFDKFELNLSEKKAKVYNLDLTDFENNKFLLNEAFINLDNEEIAGKDL